LYVLFSLGRVKELHFIPIRSPVFFSIFFIHFELLLHLSFWNILFLYWCLKTFNSCNLSV
jgi:hypothetical protein